MTRMFRIEPESPYGRRAVENAAIFAHHANRGYCKAMGDTSQKPWAVAPDWQRESAIAGVMQIVKDPNTSPAQSHEGWLKHKADAGWTYGETKDEEKKTHPCFVPYEQLPKEQQHKDAIYGAVVREALFCYERRVIRPVRSQLPAADLGFAAIEPERTHGIVSSIGRINRIASAAARAYLRATGYFVAAKMRVPQLFVMMTQACIAANEIAEAYEGFRGSQWPIILPDFGNMEPRERGMWHITFETAKAVQWVEGIEFEYPTTAFSMAEEVLVAIQSSFYDDIAKTGDAEVMALLQDSSTEK